MHEGLVERRGWISERRFLHALNFCMALPGPEAQQLASYVGYAPVIDRIRAAGAFGSSLNGITIAVVGVIAALAVFVARHALVVDGHLDWALTPLAIAAFIGVWRFRVGVVTTVIAYALVGIASTAVR